LYQEGGLGTGAIAGLVWQIKRNSSGNGAAGALNPQDRNGNDYYIWVDATGTARIGTAPPTENNTTVSDTSGSILGGGGSGTVTTTGSPTTGLIPMFSGATSITNADAAAVTAALDLLGS
jgi:hypothetical protein